MESVIREGVVWAMKNVKRAYSESDKQQRQQTIIETAQLLLTEKGFFAISMDDVAKRAGLAKGTVYLYFQTKEELFLSVFEQQANAWYNEVKLQLAAIQPPTTAEEVVNVLVDSIKDKVLFTRLVALKPILIEYNVSYDRAHTANVWLHNCMEDLDQLVADKLGLPTEERLFLIQRMYLFVSGLEGMARPSTVAQQVYASEPMLHAVNFEKELKSLLLAVLQSQS